MSEAAATAVVPAAARAGRPRDPRVDRAVREATLRLLVSAGYAGTTIQAIAREAGVSAPSIYRRWSSRAEVVEEAVFPDGLVAPEAATGDIGTDLRAYCHTIVEHLADPAVRAAIPGLLTEYRSAPELWWRLAQRSVTPMREAFVAYVAAAGAEPVVPAESLFEVMLGALFVRAVNSGSAAADEFAGDVAAVLTSAMTAGSPSAAR